MSRRSSQISEAGRKRIHKMCDRGFNAQTISKAVGVDISRINKEVSEYCAKTQAESEYVDYFPSTEYHHIM